MMDQKYNTLKKREYRDKARDIGLHPHCARKDLKKKAAMRDNLELFLKTIFKHIIYRPFSPDQLNYINKLESLIKEGGQEAIALPRGDGKTSIGKLAAIWGICAGWISYGVLIAANSECQKKLINSIKKELESNDLLNRYYPEITHYVRACDGSAQRAKHQRAGGERSNLVYGQNEINFAQIVGDPDFLEFGVGGIIEVTSINAAIRGKTVNVRGRGEVRPDFVLLDDCQTRESAKSMSQTDNLERIINGDVAFLAGRDRTLAMLFACTVITHNDLAERFLLRWSSTRGKAIYDYPENMKLWEEYINLRTVLSAENSTAAIKNKKCNEFYRKNRAAMDKGARVGNEYAYPKDSSLSALQYCFNLISDYGQDAFDAEYQNSPREDGGDMRLPTSTVMLKRQDGRKRGEVPASAVFLTAGIDVQKEVLFFVVTAWEQDGTGYIIDYGAFPEQPVPIIEASRPSVKISQLFTGTDSVRVQAAITQLAGHLLERKFPRISGSGHMTVNHIFCDAGYMPNSIYNSRMKLGAVNFEPSRGKAFGAAVRPLSEYQRRPGEYYGHHWYYPNTKKTRDFRHCVIDVNYWKTFLCDALLKENGSIGGMTVFDDRRFNHPMLIDHFTAEYYAETQGYGRTVFEWKMKPARRDNHLWDCLVYSAAAASRCGMVAEAVQNEKPKPPINAAPVNNSQPQKPSRLAMLRAQQRNKLKNQSGGML